MIEIDKQNNEDDEKAISETESQKNKRFQEELEFEELKRKEIEKEKARLLIEEAENLARQLEEEAELDKKLIDNSIEESIFRVNSMIKDGLSQISKTAQNEGFAYTTLTLKNKEIVSLDSFMKPYIHLRCINVSGNKLNDISWIKEMKHLVMLDASFNNIPEISVFDEQGILNFLQILLLNGNQISELNSFKLPKLKKLNLNDNKIHSCKEFQGPFSLEILELRGNFLIDCNGISRLASLQELFLSNNKIESLENLNDLPNLKRIYLRNNVLTELKFNKLIDFEYINLRDNKLPTLTSLQPLISIKSLNTIVILGNPVNEEQGEGLKKELIMLKGFLKRFNKEEIFEEELEEIKKELEERIKEDAEKKKLEQEENENKSNGRDVEEE